MTHTHNHDHAHHHGTDAAGEMGFGEKLEKLLAHWIKHNREHSGSYRQWAEKAKAENFEAVARFLESVAETSDEINTQLEQALAQLEVENH